jgi:acyl carrier protein
MERSEILGAVIGLVEEVGGLEAAELDDDTPLIGPHAVIKSRMLVELLLALEDFAEERLEVEFDWSSDSAMSLTHSAFRTIGTVADHLHRLSAEAR